MAKTVRIKLKTAIIFDREAVRATSVIDVPEQLAAELIDANKAERVDQTTPLFSAPKPGEAATPPVPARKTRE